MSNYEKYLKAQLQDPDFKEEYDHNTRRESNLLKNKIAEM